MPYNFGDLDVAKPKYDFGDLDAAKPAKQTIQNKIEAYEKLNAMRENIPEAGAGHYLARGAISGITAIADAIPNLYNLGKAAYGTAAIAAGRPDLAPDVGEVNPIANYLKEKAGLNAPVKPASYIGGDLGAAALEGIGAGFSQGPLGMAKAIPGEMAKQVAIGTAKNAAIGGLAGAGAQIGSEATDGSVLGSIAGGLIGGTIIPSSLLRHGGLTIGSIKAAKDIAADMKAKSVGTAEPAFSNYVNSTMKGATIGSPYAAENLTEGLRLQQQIPGFNPSVAEMANSPGLIDIQRKFALLNPKNLNAEIGRNEANLQAIKDYYSKTIPVATSPSNVRSAINQSLSGETKGLQSKAQNIAGELPKSDQFKIGETLSSLAQAEKDAAKPGIAAAYNKAFSLAPERTIDATPILEHITDTLGVPLSQLKPETAPRTFDAIKRFVGGQTPEQTIASPILDIQGSPVSTTVIPAQPVKITLQEAAELRKAVNADATLAARSADPLAATRLRNIGGVKNTIDTAIADSPVSQTAKDAFAAANLKYQTEYAPRFNEGINLNVFKPSSLNEPKILPDKFVSEYFKPDSQAGVTRAQHFNKLFENNAEAKGLVESGILDIYRQKVVNPTTGAIDQTAHNAFMRDYGRTLDSFKSQGVNAVDDIKNIGQKAAQVSSDIGKMDSLAKTLKFNTSDDLVVDALKDQKTMGNIIFRLPKESRNTFNTMLLDKAFESGTATGMRNFLETNQRTLGMAIPKEQLSAMNDIAKALELTERAPIRGNIAAGGADMLKNMTGTSTATVFSQIRAVTGGRSSVEWAAINLAMPALNKMTQTSFVNVMESALHSKDSAIALRNYLLSETPQEANKWATNLWNSTKAGGKLLWDVKGPMTKHIIGPQDYPKNIARSWPAISTQIQPDQENNLMRLYQQSE